MFSGKIVVRCNVLSWMIPWRRVEPSLLPKVTSSLLLNLWLFFFTCPISPLSLLLLYFPLHPSSPQKISTYLFLSACFRICFEGGTETKQLVLEVAIESITLRQDSETGFLIAGDKWGAENSWFALPLHLLRLNCREVNEIQVGGDTQVNVIALVRGSYEGKVFIGLVVAACSFQLFHKSWGKTMAGSVQPAVDSGHAGKSGRPCSVHYLQLEEREHWKCRSTI